MHKHNYCFIVGNLGQDPVERSRNDKTGSIVGFTVAENVQTFDKESQQYKTTHTNWFNVTAFGSLAERVRDHLKKGERVAVQGRMKIAKFTDKNGDERTGFEIIAEEVAKWEGLPGALTAGAGSEHRVERLPLRNGGNDPREPQRQQVAGGRRGGGSRAAGDESLPF